MLPFLGGLAVGAWRHGIWRSRQVGWAVQGWRAARRHHGARRVGVDRCSATVAARGDILTRWHVSDVRDGDDEI
jgi:hypothetical protein